MKKLLFVLISGTVLLVAAVLLVIWLSWQPQSWYAPPDYSQQEVKKLADRAEYRLNEEFHAIRQTDEVWRLRITDEAMNAWLSGRLEGWLTHDQELEIPEEIYGLQVHTTPEGLWIAAMVEIEDSIARPVATQVRVWFEKEKAYFEPISIRFGKIPVPVSILKNVMKEMPVDANAVVPVVPLMDAREVEIKAIDFEEGAIVLSCRTILPN